VAAAAEPGEEVADRDESLYLRGDGQWLAIPLPVLEQPLLIFLHEVKRDPCWLFDPVLLAEDAEVAEIAAPTEDRRVGVVVYTHPEQVLLDVGFEWRHRRSSFPEGSERSKLGPEPSTPTPSGPPRSRDGSVRRYYDPATGQFLSVDPAVDRTEAPYAYVNGDPVDGIDPLGLGVGSWFLGTTTAIGNYIANSPVAEPFLSVTTDVGNAIGGAYYDFASEHPCIALGISTGLQVAGLFVFPEELGLEGLAAEDGGGILSRLGVRLADETGALGRYGNLGKLADRADETVADVIRSRGGGASQVNQLQTGYGELTLGELSDLAAQGDREAVKAIKMAKQAGSQGKGGR
jgi:hypothetical protein